MSKMVMLFSVVAATAAASTRSVSVFGKFSERCFISEYALGTRLPPDKATPAAGTAGFSAILTFIDQLCKSVAALITYEFNEWHIISHSTIADPYRDSDCWFACAALCRDHYLQLILSIY